jgi:hypothetical protein
MSSETIIFLLLGGITVQFFVIFLFYSKLSSINNNQIIMVELLMKIHEKDLGKTTERELLNERKRRLKLLYKINIKKRV